MTKAEINELQSYFDGRRKLYNALNAIKCYSKDSSSFFFNYTDGFQNKRNINIPLEADDIISVIEKYIDNIDKQIMEISKPEIEPLPLTVYIDNHEELLKHIRDYESRYPDTYMSLSQIMKRLEEMYEARKTSNDEIPISIAEDYHIEVCSDWQDKIYVFSFIEEGSVYISFHFETIYKL